eukprot:CAMPEP_0174726738 /NCGR_PEP_ID=MMETSP1094-20130205/48436_1 /TAXON_ID=156173 /ORGANISM="Chrysochromulina brevifilum, Strain UTEX LB 985" /LENGTH=193 /DNA_ID=CAMNT_0015928359 /DNA_START=132 /DNA_END=710 /DNA_ORIENTATION=+
MAPSTLSQQLSKPLATRQSCIVILRLRLTFVHVHARPSWQQPCPTARSAIIPCPRNALGGQLVQDTNTLLASQHPFSTTIPPLHGPGKGHGMGGKVSSTITITYCLSESRGCSSASQVNKPHVHLIRMLTSSVATSEVQNLLLRATVCQISKPVHLLTILLGNHVLLGAVLDLGLHMYTEDYPALSLYRPAVW